MAAILTPTPESIARAAEALRAGKLIGLPTETVYGLAANAADTRAVARVFEAKGRPAFNPLIIHVASIAQAEALARFNNDARALADALWPGPLTLILPRAESCPVCDLATAGLSTIALRFPAHDTARAIIAAADMPVAAPSANASGRLSPTAPVHVAESLGDKVDLILAAGSCAVGLESTVLDLTGETPVILRSGAVTAQDIARVLGVHPETETGSQDKPKSPGQALRHYAPKTPLRLNAAAPERGEAYLAFGPTLVRGAKNLSERGDLHEAAANLFGYLHDLDKEGQAGIAIAPILEEGLGLAINDRLRRATGAQSRGTQS